ncbi:unnamed protein product [Rotaria socialis]|uniref:RecA family profile 1 domain-containing protein n=1 Tax=Rotaria socialis TaxID=392032 RepID=A0A821GZ78_9BILA|nr:unnamed protein product [Rotaria socialis]CAF3339627.1 unnamed protein product [Rotaria socialis]CAF3412270.1 unnamed protein product [Rotaria socialis]CAF3465622.1 unnamed protein product [Rotaria socialis]CAF3605185.1 unnamed protein product [Rotaria socialis]
MSFISFTSSHFTSLNLIDNHLLERFERAGIKNLIDLSAYTPLELSFKFRLPIFDAEQILEKLFSTLTIQSKNVYDMLIQTSSSYIPTKLPTLNRYLNGGLRRGLLIELCGSWGSGKTQFCLHLTAQCCLLGLHSIYIDTEHTFSSIRLLNMMGNFNSEQEHLLELVRTETAFDSDSLMNILIQIENELEDEFKNNKLDQCPILLIIDSIAAPLRMSTMGYTRDNILLLFTDRAKRLATRYNLLVLVTNQVTTKRRSNVLTEKTDEHERSNTNKTIGNDFYMSVALGKAWSYSVNVRLAISYQGDTRRQLIVGKSIESPGYSISFRILTNGLEEIEENISINTQRKSSKKYIVPKLIQADEMHLIGKQLRP